MRKLKLLFLMLLMMTASLGCTLSESWEGEYTFTETSEAHSALLLHYEVVVIKEGSDLAATVSVNGLQTALQLKCNVQVKQGKATFSVAKIVSKRSLYDIGDVLFRLEKIGDTYVTHWVEMIPQLSLDPPAKGHFFEKKWPLLSKALPNYKNLLRTADS